MKIASRNALRAYDEYVYVAYGEELCLKGNRTLNFRIKLHEELDFNEYMTLFSEQDNYACYVLKAYNNVLTFDLLTEYDNMRRVWFGEVEEDEWYNCVVRTYYDTIPAGGWLSGWQYRRAIVVNVYYDPFVRNDLGYFNVEVIVPASMLPGAKSDYSDLVVTGSDGVTYYDFKYDASTGRLGVRIPNSDLKESNLLWLYWGNPNANIPQNGGFGNFASADFIDYTIGSTNTLSEALIVEVYLNEYERRRKYYILEDEAIDIMWGGIKIKDMTIDRYVVYSHLRDYHIAGILNNDYITDGLVAFLDFDSRNDIVCDVLNGWAWKVVGDHIWGAGKEIDDVLRTGRRLLLIRKVDKKEYELKNWWWET